MTAVLNTHPHAAQLLGLLGLPAQPLMQQLAGIGQQATLLRSLIDNFQRAAGGLSAGGLGQLATQGALPPAVQVAPPNPGACRCGGHYAPPAQGGRVDLGTAPGVAPGTPAALQERLRGVQLERFLGANPFAKSQLEARLGGRILPDGLADGVLTVQRVPQGLLGGGAAGPVSPAQSALGGIQQGAAYAGLPAAGPGAFQNMMLGALANTLGGGGLLPGALPAAAAPLPAPGAAMRRPIGFDDILRPPPAFGGVPGGAAVGGVPGFGAAPLFGGGAPVMGAPGGGLGAAGGLPMAPAPAAGGKGGGLAGALNEPGLTVEDKVVMLLMQVTKGFDKQIQDQANHVNQLQQQQNGGGGKGGKGGGGKGGGGGGEASIDVESMKLKRLIDKRGQMFDMLRQIIDKYNETAKNMIQSVSR